MEDWTQALRDLIDPAPVYELGLEEELRSIYEADAIDQMIEEAQYA